MELLTRNLILRTLSVDDLEEIARMCNYPEGVTRDEADLKNKARRVQF